MTFITYYLHNVNEKNLTPRENAVGMVSIVDRLKSSNDLMDSPIEELAASQKSNKRSAMFLKSITDSKSRNTDEHEHQDSTTTDALVSLVIWPLTKENCWSLCNRDGDFTCHLQLDWWQVNLSAERILPIQVPSAPSVCVFRCAANEIKKDIHNLHQTRILSIVVF